MTPEARVKTAVKKLLTQEGVYYFMPVSNGMGRHGIPDIICCVNGRFLAIECKANGGKVTALQERELLHIASAGGVSIVVTDEAHTHEALSNTITTLKLNRNAYV